MYPRLIGPTCSEDACNRPPYEGGKCFAHWSLDRAVGRSPVAEPSSVALRVEDFDVDAFIDRTLGGNA